MRYDFASDNTSGHCPETLASLTQANAGYHASYGDDPWTAQAADALRDLFGTRCDVYFVFNGTAANSLSLASLCQSYHSVIAADCAHIETDECGAPEFFSSGTKIQLAPAIHGKIAPADVERIVTRRSDIHYPRPRVISLTQVTELGTVYSPDDVAALGSVARRYGLSMHMDGARFANAIATLGCAPADVTWKAGVDVLCFGGTKNGIGCGEAVVFFRPELSTEFAYRCKQAGQLASKMRLVAAPWATALRQGVWLSNARHANAMAARLVEKLEGIEGVRLCHPRQANGVFLELPAATSEYLATKWKFYRFIAGAARFMCSWSTTPADVDALAADIRRAPQTGIQ